MVRTTVVGSYPRIGDTYEEQELRRAIAEFDRHGIGIDALRKAEQDAIARILAEQNDAGIDVVTDGQVAWHDAVSHLTRSLQGVEVTGLARYFDTNTYYRQPAIRGRVRGETPVLVEDWRFAQEHSRAAVKATLTGPVTLASLSSDAHYGNPHTLALDLAAALAQEVRALVQAGARHLQVDEPILSREPGSLDLVAEAFERIVEAKGEAEITLAVFFGDVAGIFRDLTRLPADILLLDLIQGARTWSEIARHGSDTPLALGLIDARNTRLEDPKVVAAKVRELRERIDLGQAYLCPSNGLEFLPRSRARDKLRILVESANLVGARR